MQQSPVPALAGATAPQPALAAPRAQAPTVAVAGIVAVPPHPVASTATAAAATLAATAASTVQVTPAVAHTAAPTATDAQGPRRTEAGRRRPVALAEQCLLQGAWEPPLVPSPAAVPIGGWRVGSDVGCGAEGELLQQGLWPWPQTPQSPLLPSYGPLELGPAAWPQRALWEQATSAAAIVWGQTAAQQAARIEERKSRRAKAERALALQHAWAAAMQQRLLESDAAACSEAEAAKAAAHDGEPEEEDARPRLRRAGARGSAVPPTCRGEPADAIGSPSRVRYLAHRGPQLAVESRAAGASGGAASAADGAAGGRRSRRRRGKVSACGWAPTTPVPSLATVAEEGATVGSATRAAPPDNGRGCGRRGARQRGGRGRWSGRGNTAAVAATAGVGATGGRLPEAQSSSRCCSGGKAYTAAPRTSQRAGALGGS